MGINMSIQRLHLITIEREFASGGQEIGELTAKALGIPCYGKEILDLAAKKLHTDRESLERLEEKAVSSLMYSMYIMANMGRNGAMSRESELFLAESEVIRELTQTPAVIVGRCATHSLADRKDVLRVFVRADKETRKDRAVKVYGLFEETAMDALRRADKRRGGYYRANTGRDWKDCANYHLVMDSGVLGIEKCADILENCFRKGGDRI